jgi:hypothetical protein
MIAIMIENQVPQQKTQPTVPPAAPAFTLTKVDKVVFVLVFTLEITLFVLFAGCSIAFAPAFGGMSPFLIPIPFLLFFHYQAFKNYKQLETGRGTPRSRGLMQLWLAAPFLLIFIAYLLLSGMKF